MTVVLDASALLALLFDEPGAESVVDLIAGSVVAAPNWSEVMQKVAAHGGDPTAIAGALVAAGVEVEPLWREDAERAAALWTTSPELSLTDRCCLVLAERLEVAAATADRGWVGRVPGVDVVVIG